MDINEYIQDGRKEEESIEMSKERAAEYLERWVMRGG